MKFQMSPWLQALIGVLFFGVGNGLLDGLFSNNYYGVLFYPAFLSLVFLVMGKYVGPERAFEGVAGVFVVLLAQSFLRSFFISWDSYFLWAILVIGTLVLIFIGREGVRHIYEEGIWHYYFGLACMLHYAHFLAFRQETYGYSCVGILFFVFSLGILLPYRLVPILILLGGSIWSHLNWIPYTEGAEEKPNLLLITVDTLRRDALSCYGSTNVTPTIDRLATEGILYENAYATAPWTLPSICSILTGLYPSALGMGMEFNPEPLPPLSLETEPLALVLRRNGYRTIGMVSNFWLTTTRKMDTGFDHYKNFPDYYYPTLDEPQPLFLRLVYWMYPNVPGFSSGKYVLDTAYQHLEQGKGAYFLWVHLIEPHLPYHSDIDVSVYKESKGNLENFESMKVDQGNIRKGLWKLTPEARRFLHWWYNQEVIGVDKLLGDFLQKLESQGYLKNTLIVFASDHGEEFWEHGSVVHGHTLYNELIRVPLILHYPEVLSPQREEKKVSHTQIYPTILNLLKVPPIKNKAWRGPDLRTFLPYIFSEALLYFEDRKALISQAHEKWIYFYGKTSEIYDLALDPGEKNPLSQKPLEEWKKNFESWREQNESINQILEKGRTQIQISEEEKNRLRSLGYN